MNTEKFISEIRAANCISDTKIVNIVKIEETDAFQNRYFNKIGISVLEKMSYRSERYNRVSFITADGQYELNLPFYDNEYTVIASLPLREAIEMYCSLNDEMINLVDV